MKNSFGYNKEILDLLIKPRNKKPDTEEVSGLVPIEANKKEDTLEKQEKDDAKKDYEKRAIVKLNGIQVSETGQLTKTRYFDMLKIDDDQYDDIKFTPEEAKKVSMALKAMSTGLTASIPLLCKGPDCAFASTCQPPGTKVLLNNGLSINIEDLDPAIHRLSTFARERGKILGYHGNGFKFTKHERDFSGELIYIQTRTGKSHHCTPDHISIARWNESAIDKFCVYIMNKGDYWRIGKTKLISVTSNGYTFGPQARLSNEKGDSVWILGVYSTNTESLLAEEYFSCKYGISKSLFIATGKNDGKYDGLYSWVTQEMLDKHHESLIPSKDTIDKLFRENNLSPEMPIYSRLNRDSSISSRMSTNQIFKIRSQNLISNYMDVIVFDSEDKKYFDNIRIERVPYVGKVYSLDVDVYHTYISNNIITHNCPYQQANKAPLARPCIIEKQLISYWTEQYIEEFQVNFNSFTELRMVAELAEFDIYEMRVTKYIAETDPTLMQEVTTGFSDSGMPITNIEISRAFDLKERIKKNRMKVLEALVATRRDRAKIMSEVIKGTSTAEKMDDLKKKLETLKSEIGNMTIIEGEVVRVSTQGA